MLFRGRNSNSALSIKSESETINGSDDDDDVTSSRVESHPYDITSLSSTLKPAKNSSSFKSSNSSTYVAGKAEDYDEDEDAEHHERLPARVTVKTITVSDLKAVYLTSKNNPQVNVKCEYFNKSTEVWHFPAFSRTKNNIISVFDF